jgi:hypothetical protein
MKPHVCPFESDLWNAIASGEWPERAETSLRAHVVHCAICRDVELVAGNLYREARAVRTEAAPPSSAIVWWRAQMRARQEAATAADRPITIVQSIAIACAAGLVLGLLGSVAAWVRGSAGWFDGWTVSASSMTALLGTVDFTSRWVMVPALLVALTLVIMPIALYAIVSEK